MRRAAVTAALGALLAPAAAGAATAEVSKAKKVKLPVITSVSPLKLAVGGTLEIRGRNFLRGRNRNSVVFKRDGGRAVFVKADVGTTKLLRFKLPAKLQQSLIVSGGQPSATRFRLRVLAKKFGKSFTRTGLSPTVSPAVQLLAAPGGPGSTTLTPAQQAAIAESGPDGDCDGDGIKNRNETDSDDDLLPDTLENSIGTDYCNKDTDGDGVEDGFEFRSAQDLNDDEYQGVNQNLPYPGPRPYPNPLFKDSDVDYDGDSLTMAEEQSLWKYTYSVTHTDARTLDPLSYSDGEKSSKSHRGIDGRRVPDLSAVNYYKHDDFINWASGAGYRTVYLADSPGSSSFYGLFDVNRDGTETNSEIYYFDFNGDTFLSDDERDEDGDGLSNYDETHGRMLQEYWKSCYALELPFHISYAGTDPANADTDGDGVRDGADDQDHDDIPNIMELSRFAASGDWDNDVNKGECNPAENLPQPPATNHPGDYGRVNPFNPCLPAIWSRTCPSHVNSTTGAPFDNSPNWYSLN